MTAGRGIAHSEESLTARLHLAQLWIAPGPTRTGTTPPAFEHFPTLPALARRRLRRHAAGRPTRG